MSTEPIAIIGIGCRFPQAANPHAFWHLLCNGIDAITPIPTERSQLNFSIPNSLINNYAGLVERIEEFDAQFFGITPREVMSMDPQQRILLEVVWEAMEDAAIIPQQLAETPVGVFVGIPRSDYYELLRMDTNLLNSAYTVTGNSSSIAANRISYIFNLTGPSLAIDTACSSSLVAVHLACQSLHLGESNLAIAAGVQILLSSQTTISLAQAGMISTQGRCRTFDAQADGFVRGEGVGVVILKPLSQALIDQNLIYGVIRGSAINQDGRTNGLTAPNLKAQTALLRRAYQNAGISPSSVQYVEAQGTGTLLGDAIELEALAAVLGENRPGGSFCRVGSVKTNIGHLEAASGIASLIKVALALKYKQIPPSLHFQQSNSYVKLDQLALQVQQTLEPWLTDTRAIAGVSAFGFGGTNAHIVLEAADDLVSQPKQSDRPLHLFTLSAKTETALRELSRRYLEFLPGSCDIISDITIDNICYTANTGRTQFNHRLAVIANSQEQLAARLQVFATGEQPTGSKSGVVRPKQRPKIGFLFTGLITNQIKLDRQLYETQPTFRQIIDRCDDITFPSLGKSLIDILYSPITQDAPTDEIAQTTALFALQVALVELWKSWGIQPDMVMGTSLGEIAAAYTAGIFSLADGLKIISIMLNGQERIKSTTTPGMMVGIFADEEQVAAAILPFADKVAIAFLDGVQVVISGEQAAVQLVANNLKQQGAKILRWSTSYAYHSPLMSALEVDLAESRGKFTLHPPQIPFVSGINGHLSTDAATPDYWMRVVREPVRLPTAMQTMHQQGISAFVEIGPKPILLPKGMRCLPDNVGTWLPSLRPEKSSWEQLLFTLSQLYVLGASVNWLGFDQDYSRHYVPIPTYPFERQHYWVEIPQNSAAPSQSIPKSVPTQPASSLVRSPVSRDLVATTQQLDDYLAEQLGMIMGFSPSQLDKQQPLNTLGLDSLMALQLINRVRKDLAVELPLEALLENISIGELSRQIHEILAENRLTSSEHFPQLTTNQPTNILPLSFAQEEFWLLEQLNPNSPFFNLSLTFNFTGVLDISALERSLNEIVRRHAALRTTFDIIDGQPRQIVHTAWQLPLPVVYLQDLSESAQLMEVAKLSQGEALKPLDFITVPPIRAMLLKLADEHYILLVTLHHLISDGSSLVIFGRELQVIYQAFAQGQLSPLPELQIHYPDFILQQQRSLHKERLSQLQNYWQKKLGGQMVAPKIPTDQPRPVIPKFRGGIKSFQISQALSAQLTILSQQERCTLFILLLAAWQILMHHYTGQVKFCLATITANRSKSELEGIIGCLVNFVPIMSDLTENCTFRQFLPLVRQSTLEAYAHQDIPLKYILEVAPSSTSNNYCDQSPQSALPVVLFFHNQFSLLPEEIKITELLSVGLQKRDNGGAKRDLTLHMGKNPAGIWGSLEYDLDIFNQNTIDQMIEKYLFLLQKLAANPDGYIANPC